MGRGRSLFSQSGGPSGPAGGSRGAPLPGDRRIQRLGLSEAGEALHAALRAERQAVAARMLGRLSCAEQAQLAALLARMVAD